MANTTDYIQAVLSSTPEIFQNCVIMTVNATSPFMAKGKVEKRKFIEQIFNLQIFSEMLSNIREDHNKVSKTFDIESAKHDEIKRSLSMYETQLRFRSLEKETKISNINSKILSNNKNIDDLRTQLKESENIDITAKSKEIELYNNGYEAIEEKIKNIIVLATEAATVIKQINAKISKVGTAEDVCPTCLRPIDVDDRKYFEDEKKSLNTNVILLNNNILKFKTDSDLLKDKKTKIKLHILKINDELNGLKVKIKNRESLQKLINDLIDLNNQLAESITSINNNDNSSSEIIVQMKERLEASNQEIDSIKKVLNLLETVKFVVSEEGVKSYIVKKILQNFNSKLAYYLKLLDSNSICVFNE